MDPTYRFVDHTADFAVELDAPSLEALFEVSVRALAHVLTDDPDVVRDLEARRLCLDGLDREELLVGLGNEVLYRFEVEGWLAARLEVRELSDERLEGELHGEPFTPARHDIARPIKAVTHHGAAIEVSDDGRVRGTLLYDL
ncbi:MAG: archease [Sandaracinaceae bacterium]